MVLRPISKSLGTGGIYRDLGRLTGANSATCTFEAYMMPPYGFVI